KRGTGTSPMLNVYSRRMWRAAWPGGPGVSSRARAAAGLGEEAAAHAARHRHERRLFAPAALEDERAAGVEAAARRRPRRRRHVAGERHALREAAHGGIERGYGVEQRARIGMARIGEQALAVRLLDDLPQV